MIHQNSITSFEQLSFKAGLSQSEKVYHALELLGPQTDRQLGSSTGIPYHLIPRCRAPLVAFDSIKQIGSKIDPVTNRTVSVWATSKSVDRADAQRASEAVRQVMANAPSQIVQSGGLFGLLVAVALCLAPFQAEAKTIVVKQTVRTIYAKEIKTVKSAKPAKMTEKQAVNKLEIVHSTPINKTYQKHQDKAFYEQIYTKIFTMSNQPDAFMEIIAKESGFNPYAVNASSGACGLAQALPCEKMGCDLGDVDCQLNWMNSYINRRYGSPEQALNFHLFHGWY